MGLVHEKAGQSYFIDVVAYTMEIGARFLKSRAIKVCSEVQRPQCSASVHICTLKVGIGAFDRLERSPD